MIGIVVNTILAVAKLLAGMFGHSFALVADSVESMVDIVGSFVIWGALQYGGKPPDTEHPFGHGKAEPLAAVAVAGLVGFAGVGIAAQAGHELLTKNGNTEGPRVFTLVILAVVVLVKEIMFILTRRAARRSGSSAGQADAGHHRADSITSAFAFVGIAIALAGGAAWRSADNWAALAASVVIFINGLRLAREPLGELMDRHHEDVAEQCVMMARRIEGVRDVERCEARKSGRAYRIVMHVEVRPDMTVEDSHRLTGIIKAQIRRQMPAVLSVLVHIEPYKEK